MENNQKNQQLSLNVKAAIIGYCIIIVISIIGGIFGVYKICTIDNSVDKKYEQQTIKSDILSALKYDGYKYTDKSTFTEEDFTAEEVVESDYKPIYKLKISNGDILYIALVYSQGKNALRKADYYYIDTNLDRVKNSINQ